MLSGMAVPGDSVGEEDVDGSVGFMIPLLSQEKLERRGRPEKHSIKGME